MQALITGHLVQQNTQDTSPFKNLQGEVEESHTNESMPQISAELSG